jgi:hypothetical protein
MNYDIYDVYDHCRYGRCEGFWQKLEVNPRERIGFAELSAKWRIGSPLLAVESASIKNLP